MTRQWLSAMALAVACTAVPVDARAQESVDQASVGGRVTDEQGGAVSAARVRARQTETNQVTETSTDANGRFRFSSLRIGAYEIRVDRTGFAGTAHTLTLTAGAAFDVPLTLRVAAVSTSVAVSAALP